VPIARQYARISGQRVTVRVEGMQQFIQRRPGRGGEHIATLVDPKEDAAFVPPGNSKATKTQPDLCRGNRCVQADRARR
jgi:hypothetical protein